MKKQTSGKNSGKKTAKPTQMPSPTPLPTKVPEQTMLPPDETPGPTVEPVRNNQGLYAENEELIII